MSKFYQRGLNAINRLWPGQDTKGPLFEDWEAVVAACHQWARWEKRKIIRAGWETEDFMHSHFLRLRTLELKEITQANWRARA